MGGTLTQIVVALGILRFVLWADDQTVEVTQELLQQHKEKRIQEMAQLLEMEQRSQEVPETIQGSLLLSACQHWWFWAFAEMLLMLFGFYWLPRKHSSDYDSSGYDSSGYDSSACGETPAVPRRKRRRRRRRRRRRMRGIGDYGDKLDQIGSLDLCLEWKDMQNAEEEGMEGMISASAKPFPQETFGQSRILGIR